ncbi:SelB domain-containing protein [Robbsia andropogonis]|uniref:SelB domain-containing protein n=1 Tax=Robbsia andropogonis TaxID=28092 RepID=UPI00209C8B83|nr:SelB C-terminal domain-containing protein [Robbsia andropogonis]
MIVAMTGRAGSGKTTLTRVLTGVDSAGLSDESRGGMWVIPAYSYLSSAPAPVNGVRLGVDAVLAVLDGPPSTRVRQAHWDAVDVVLWAVDAADDIDAQIDAEAFCARACPDGLHCIVVLTRLDTLAPAAAEQARRALRQRLGANGDTHLTIFETCATDPFDVGVHALRHHLTALAATATPRALRTVCVEHVLSYDGTGIRVAEVRADPEGRSSVTLVPSREHGTWLVDAHDFVAWTGAAIDALQAHHALVPNDEGLAASLLRKLLQIDIPNAAWRAITDALCMQGRLVRSGACLQLPEHRRQMPDADGVPVSGIVADLATGRFNPPWVRDIAANRQLPEARVRRILQQLAHEGRVYEVVPDLFYDRFQIAILARLLHSLAQLGVGSNSGAKGEVAAAIFRDATGVGRKRAIQILEFFDRIGFTQRVADSHCVEPESDWIRWFDIPQESPPLRTTSSDNVNATLIGRSAVSPAVESQSSKANC